jgi:hypothetical protein
LILAIVVVAVVQVLQIAVKKLMTAAESDSEGVGLVDCNQPLSRFFLFHSHVLDITSSS